MSFLFVSDTWSFVCLVSNPANVPRWALGTSTGRARYTKGGERNAANQIPNFTMNFDCSFVLNSAPRADIPKSAADFILTIIFWFTCALNPDAAPRWQPGLHGTRRCKSKCEVSPIIFVWPPSTDIVIVQVFLLVAFVFFKICLQIVFGRLRGSGSESTKILLALVMTLCYSPSVSSTPPLRSPFGF